MRSFRNHFKFLFLLVVLIPNLVFCQSWRDRYQQPEKIMDVVGIKPGMVIGEAGAGDGYFTFHMAKRVGEKGLIYANDIDESELDKLRDEAEDKNLKNIEIIVGEVKDPLFPKNNSLDMIVMVLVFHHLDDHVSFFKNLIPSLKPGAPVVIVDRNPDKYGQDYDHFYKKEKTLRLMRETDFELVKVETFLERDDIFIYRLPEELL